LDACDELAYGFGLVSGGLVGGVEFKIHADIIADWGEDWLPLGLLACFELPLGAACVAWAKLPSAAQRTGD
jgi:hypothetical protein